MTRSGLEVADLACGRGGRMVFRGVGFALGPGEALALRGPNGSGKSSLLRILAGLLPPTAGTLRWDGADIAADRDAHRARTGYLGMLDALKPALTVAETLRFHAALAGADPDAVARALIAMDLDSIAARPTRQLSQGQRRRVAMARLLATRARLWLLDEPTLALDDGAIARLGTALAAHLAAGGIAVIATHVDLTLTPAATLDFGAGA